MKNDKYCAVIITALPVEFNAVRRHLADIREEDHPKGTVYERGKFIAGDRVWDLGVVEIGRSNPAAALEAERAISYFDPGVVLLVGVAGGLKDVAIGDVVAATEAFGFEAGKDKRFFLPRPVIFRSTYRMVQRARAVARSDSWLKRISGHVKAAPKAFVEPIAAGEKVVASTRSATYRFLRSNFSNALSVETEGVGFLNAAYANFPLEALVIRGISDLLDGKSAADAAGSQEIASHRASAFAFEVLAKLGSPRIHPTPSAKPAIWSVPYRRNPNFAGREAILDNLHTRLKATRNSTDVHVVHGLGGVGKTQLVVEYAYRFAKDYNVVAWLSADEPTALATDYAALARPLGLPYQSAGEIADHPTVIAAVRHKLEQVGDWLLIFDNAHGPTGVRDYLPQRLTGHTLATSRNPNWRGIGETIRLRRFDRRESVAFLRKRTGGTDDVAAARLAEAVGHLPLALEQAASYIEATGISYAQFVHQFRRERLRLLERGAVATGYPHTVATTWKVSLDRIRQTSPAASALVNLLAFVASDAIPRELISGKGHHLPRSLAGAAARAAVFDAAVSELIRYSLVEAEGDVLSAHPLVQAVVQDLLTMKERRFWAETAVRLLDEAFPEDADDVRTWLKCARLLPHALRATRQAGILT